MKVQSIVALAVVALAIAACGGGGGGGTTPSSPSNALLPTNAPVAGPTTAPTGSTAAPATAAPLPAGYAVANVTITIPKASVVSSARRAQTIGTGTQSITFTLLQNNGVVVSNPPTPQSYGLTSTSPGCSTSAQSGNLVCTLNVNAPVTTAGNTDIFLAQTYTGTNGTGSNTGSGAVQLSVAINAANSASLSLSGQVSSVYLASTAAYLGVPSSAVARRGASSVNRAAAQAAAKAAAARRATAAARAGTAQASVSSIRIFVIALDSSGNTVLNPATFSSPVTLQMIYTYNGAPDTSGTPDVNLSVAYNSAVDPNGCGSNAQPAGNPAATPSFGVVYVCAPTDVITATFVPVTSNAASSAIIIGSVGGSGNLSAPNGQPTALPTSYPSGINTVSFSIYQVIVSNNLSLVDIYGYGVSSVAANGTGSAQGVENLPLYSWESGGYNTFYVNDSGFSSFTIGGTCISGGFATVTGTSSNPYYGWPGYLLTPTAPTGGCTITVSDGTNPTATINMTVTTTTVGPVS